MKRKGDIAINYMLILALGIIVLLILVVLYTSFGETMSSKGKELASQIKIPQVD